MPVTDPESIACQLHLPHDHAGVHEGAEGAFDSSIIILDVKNTSRVPIEIKYERGYWPYQYLTLDIRNEKGDMIASLDCIQLISSITLRNEDAVLLSPGQSYSVPLHIQDIALAFGIRLLVSGVYQVQATFHYKTLSIKSNILQVGHGK